MKKSKGRVENNTSWFRRQPQLRLRWFSIFNVFFSCGSGGVPRVPLTILISDRQVRKQTAAKLCQIWSCLGNSADYQEVMILRVQVSSFHPIQNSYTLGFQYGGYRGKNTTISAGLFTLPYSA